MFQKEELAKLFKDTGVDFHIEDRAKGYDVLRTSNKELVAEVRELAVRHKVGERVATPSYNLSAKTAFNRITELDLDDVLANKNITATVHVDSNGVQMTAKMALLNKFYEAKIGCYLRGYSGIGKSETVEALMALKGKKCHVLKLSGMLPEDLQGIPQIVEATMWDGTKVKSYEFAIPKWALDLRPGDALFLDELNQARPDVLNCLFGICDKKPRLGNLNLPGIWVVAAGNLNEENYGLHDIPVPLVPGRLVPIDWAPDEDFLVNHWGTKATTVKRILECKTSPRVVERAWRMVELGIDATVVAEGLKMRKDAEPDKALAYIEKELIGKGTLPRHAFEAANVDGTAETAFRTNSDQALGLVNAADLKADQRAA